MDSTQEQSGGFRAPDRWNSVPVPGRVAARAYERAEANGEGCRISTYSVGSHGYAQVGWYDRATGRNQMVLAHRAAWVHVNGQMPLGMTIDHLCKTRRCVNPEHLRVLPNYENARRVHGNDWPMGYCANGHPNSMRPSEPLTTSAVRRVSALSVRRACASTSRAATGGSGTQTSRCPKGCG